LEFAVKMGTLETEEIGMALYMGAAGIGPRVFDAWDIADPDADENSQGPQRAMIMERAHGDTICDLLDTCSWNDVSDLASAHLELLYTTAKNMDRHHVVHADFHDNQVIFAPNKQMLVIDWAKGSVHTVPGGANHGQHLWRVSSTKATRRAAHL
jgi:predicted Ser/Thr protein kinase